MCEMRYLYKISMGKGKIMIRLEDIGVDQRIILKRVNGIPRHRWKDNIKIDFKGTVW
jgi:hypothetical protein